MANHLLFLEMATINNKLFVHTESYKYLRSAKDLYIKYCSLGFQSPSDTVLVALDSEVASPPIKTKNVVL